MPYKATSSVTKLQNAGTTSSRSGSIAIRMERFGLSEWRAVAPGWTTLRRSLFEFSRPLTKLSQSRASSAASRERYTSMTKSSKKTLLGVSLRQFREYRGLTQVQLAQRADVD